jgi:hypothetical protein
MQGKNASRQKYYAAEGFDPLLDPELLWQFSSQNGKSSSISPLSDNSEFESEHATKASASNARLKRSLRKFCLRPSGQKAEHSNFGI